MKLWKPTTIAITLAAALAITTSLSAQDNSSPKTSLMTGGGRRSQVIVYGDSLADNHLQALRVSRPALLEWTVVEWPRRCGESVGHLGHAFA